VAAASRFASMLLGIGLMLTRSAAGAAEDVNRPNRIPSQGGWALPYRNPVIDGLATLADEGQVKVWFGGHAPISALRPLVVRDYSGEEFDIYYTARSVAGFR